MLKSFKRNVDQTTYPATISFQTPFLMANPLVADADVAFYTKSTATFKLKKDIKSMIRDFGPDKGFAVTVDGQPVYYGKIHPSYLSSITVGLAAFDPVLYENQELRINYAKLDTSAHLLSLIKEMTAE